MLPRDRSLGSESPVSDRRRPLDAVPRTTACCGRERHADMSQCQRRWAGSFVGSLLSSSQATSGKFSMRVDARAHLEDADSTLALLIMLSGTRTPRRRQHRLGALA